MKLLRKCKSAPELFNNFFVEETITQLKKSASAQMLTELTQMSVEDLKQATEILSDIGNNANEIIQSGIQLWENENESPSSRNKIALLFVHVTSRLFVANIVHELHRFMLFLYNYVIHFFH